MTQKQSEAFDGGPMDKDTESIDRADWASYSLIGDALRGDDKYLALDISATVYKKLTDSEGVEGSRNSRTFTSRISEFLDRLKIPKPSPYQFASFAIVFSLGVSVDNIIERSSIYGNGHQVYVDSSNQLIGSFEVSEQLESECDISEVFVDELIMHHERLSGSPGIC